MIMAILPKEYLSFVDVACYLNGKGMGYIVGNSYDMNMLSHDLWDLISEDKLQPYIYCASIDYNFQSVSAHFPISIDLVHQLLKKENVISIDSIPTVGNNKESLYIKLIEPLELSFYELRFKRKELDKLFSNEKEKDDKTINELNQRIKQLEQQLEQRQLTQPDINSTYTTPAIEVMNAVINEFWLNYNPNKPAPKQSSVTTWITDHYKDISKALALNIDKVCRHPEAKAGGQFKK